MMMVVVVMVMVMLNFSTAYFNNHFFSYIKTHITFFTCFHENAARS
jgi:hypothetical protein